MLVFLDFLANFAAISAERQMKMRHLLLNLFTILLPLTALAQKLTVESMQATNDLSASQFRRNDLNGQPCALIKVSLAAPGATFEGNVIQPVEYKINEYWVYMTKGSKELHVKHPNYQTLAIYFGDYGIEKGVQPLATYTLSLSMPQSDTENDIEERQKVNHLIELYKSCIQNQNIELMDSLIDNRFKSVSGSLVAHKTDTGIQRKVKYNKQSKEEYLKRIQNTFDKAKNITLNFENMKIERWSYKTDYYIVTFNQIYQSSIYSGKGYVMMLCKVPELKILLRTWQPEEDSRLFSSEDMIDLLMK